MEFQLNIQHTAANEAGLLTFLTFIKDTYAAEVHNASAASETLQCQCTLVLASLPASVAAVTAFKAQFTITYRLVIA